jgi:hypothetical protein
MKSFFQKSEVESDSMKFILLYASDEVKLDKLKNMVEICVTEKQFKFLPPIVYENTVDVKSYNNGEFPKNTKFNQLHFSELKCENFTIPDDVEIIKLTGIMKLKELKSNFPREIFVGKMVSESLNKTNFVNITPKYQPTKLYFEHWNENNNQ